MPPKRTRNAKSAPAEREGGVRRTQPKRARVQSQRAGPPDEAPGRNTRGSRGRKVQANIPLADPPAPPKRPRTAPRIVSVEAVKTNKGGDERSDPLPPSTSTTITPTPEGRQNRIQTTVDVHEDPRESLPCEHPDYITVSNSARVNATDNVDPITRLADVLESLAGNKDASVCDSDSRLGNRLKFARKLPDFSGDPLEWLHFKEIYKSSSDLGGYNDRENISRLFEALKGEARDTVKTLLATTSDADAVLETLELHYGSRNVVAKRILSDIYGLADLDSNKINITQFATKLRNAVSALKSLKFTGYLCSPDLIKSVASKLPSALKYAYNRYAAIDTSHETDLEKLASFLHEEAELARTAGIFDLDTLISTPTQSSSSSPGKKLAEPSGSAVVCTNVEKPHKGDARAESKGLDKKNCINCDRPGHGLAECKEFAKLKVNRRWYIVGKNRLCYKCLGGDHMRDGCKIAPCHICRKNHHSLLHHFKEKNDRIPEYDGKTPTNEKGEK